MPIKKGITIANCVTLFGILIWLCALYVRLFVDTEIALPVAVTWLLGTISFVSAIACFLPWWHKQFLKVTEFMSFKPVIVNAVVALVPIIFGCNAILFHDPPLDPIQFFSTGCMTLLVIRNASVLPRRFRFALNSN